MSVGDEQQTGQNTPITGEAAKDDVNNAPKGDENLLTGETKPEGEEAKGEGDAPKGEGEQPKAEGEESQGEYEFKIPDGYEVDEEMASAFTETAKELGLDQAAVDKLTPFYEKALGLQMERYQEQVADWAEQVKSDKEIGGDKLQENLAVARTAIEQFGGDELKEILNATGLGNHPAMVKFAYSIGKAISGDAFVRGNPPAGEKKTAANTLFPGMN